MATPTNQISSGSSSGGTGKKPSLRLFSGLALIALLKDTLDFIGLGSLPGIGTVVTLCFSFLIFMLLLTFDRSGNRGNRLVAQGMVMTFFTLLESIGFVLNFLPFETLTIVFLYRISYHSWEDAQKKAGLANRILTKKEKVQQARMAQSLAQQEQAAAAQSKAGSDAQAGIAAATAASVQNPMNRAPRMMDSRSLETAKNQPLPNSGTATAHSQRGVSSGVQVSGSQSALRPVSGQRATNDASYAAGRTAGNEAVMRIREAGSRMAQASSPSRQTASEAPRPGAMSIPRRDTTQRVG